jgi:hypothetical protein
MLGISQRDDYESAFTSGDQNILHNGEIDFETRVLFLAAIDNYGVAGACVLLLYSRAEGQSDQ